MADNEEQLETAKSGKKREESVLSEAKERLKKCIDHDSKQRTKEIDDLEFLDGDDQKQWDPNVVQERRRDGRPALTVNRLDQFVQHITNAQRQNRIAARVFPVDDVGDPDTAEIIQGHTRHIEANSDGELVYGTGAFYAVASGRGYYILRTKYTSPMSFDTEIVMERVENPFQIYLDWNHRHPTGKDAKFGFKICKYSKDEYEDEYGEDSTKGWSDLPKDGDPFIDGDEVYVVEYWRISCDKDTLVRLADGSAALKSKMPADAQLYLDEKGNPVERETGIETVEWFKLSPDKILDETVWPTTPEYCSIPIVKVVGNELDVNGRQVLKGIIRNLKDAQRQYNFMLSAQTEAVDSSKSQIVVEDGQIEGHEQEWAEANKRKVLPVTGKSLDGSQANMPFRLQPNMSVPAMTEARLMAADDLKALTGIYDAALGNQSNETSGRAINSRQAQSDIANYHFTGNLVRSVNHSTRLIIGAIPQVIDTPRAIRIIGQDDKQEVVQVNQHMLPQEQQMQIQQQAEQDPKMKALAKFYKLGGGEVGKYDVVCSAGPSPATMKEERAIRMTELVKVAPGLMNIAPDLILADLGGSHELVERLKKSLPPELQDNSNEDEVIPPQVMAKMQQMSQQHDQMTQALQQAQQEIDTKQTEQNAKIQIAQMEIQSKESIERMKIEAQIAIAEITAKTQSALQRQKLEGDLEAKLQVQDDAQAHQGALEAAKAAHQVVMAKVQHEQGMEAQQAAAENQPAQGDE